MYVIVSAIEAPDDATANAICGDADDLIGAFAQGSANGITGVRVFGGANVTKVASHNYWVSS
jgi:hypothetical protein